MACLFESLLKASELRKPYVKSGYCSKTAYSCNAEFMVGFCTMSDKKSELMLMRRATASDISPGLGSAPDRDGRTDGQTDRIAIANMRYSSTCRYSCGA